MIKNKQTNKQKTPNKTKPKPRWSVHIRAQTFTEAESNLLEKDISLNPYVIKTSKYWNEPYWPYLQDS